MTGRSLHPLLSPAACVCPCSAQHISESSLTLLLKEKRGTHPVSKRRVMRPPGRHQAVPHVELVPHQVHVSVPPLHLKWQQVAIAQCPRTEVLPRLTATGKIMVSLRPRRHLVLRAPESSSCMTVPDPLPVKVFHASIGSPDACGQDQQLQRRDSHAALVHRRLGPLLLVTSICSNDHPSYLP